MADRIWVVGSAVLDLVFHAERFPRPGETLLGSQFNSFPGGKGANQSVAIARLGGEVSFVGCVGNDAFGQSLRSSLEAAGVDTSHLQTHPGAPTGCASIVLDAAGNNQIVVAPGANAEVSASQVAAAQIGEGEYVLLQLEIPMETNIAAARGRKVFLNPAPACALGEEMYADALVITPNETETEMLTGVRPDSPESCRAAASRLLDRGVKNVVLTLGARGCYWMSPRLEALVPAPAVKAVDTVGAGDAFSGALALFLSQGRDWPNALALANHAAALSATRPGAQTSMPSRGELQDFAGNLL